MKSPEDRFPMMMLILRFRIAITKLDILDVFDEVKIGVAYWIDDKKIEDSFPGESGQ